ncbi:MAG: hypothetical protein VKM01_02795 [Cyanobacteriota bacterium]|jgi:hypothetical protein|nr:hypothetical protein [Cyanobacteriota bacterium]
MAGIPDRAYNTACARLASAMGVSLAAARRRVDVRAAQAGLRASDEKLALADQMLADLRASADDIPALLSAQLGTVGNDDRFMVED